MHDPFTTWHLLKKLWGKIEAASRVIVVMSPHTEGSKWVRREMHLAIDHKAKQVIPLKIATCEPSEIYMGLVELQHIDCRSGFAEAIPRLAAVLSRGR